MLVFRKRLNKKAHTKYIVLTLSIFLSFAIGGIIFLVNGVNPFLAFSSMFSAVFNSFYGITETLLLSIPICFCALGIALAARMKIWNIGAEGQFVMGGFGAALVALYLNFLPPVAVIILMFLSGIFFSGLIAAICGGLKALFNVNEILLTLMFNYIAVLWINFLVYGPMKGKDNFPYSEYFPSYTNIMTLFNSRLNLGIIFVIIIAIILYFILKRSIWGYQIRVVGESVDAARYAGIPVKRNIFLVLTLSGILAGLGGVFEVSGLQHRLQPSIAAGYGFTGIIVAWLAKNDMLKILPVGFLMAGLFVGSNELQMFYKIPNSVVKIFQGIILLCVLGGDIFIENKLVWEKK